MKNTKTKTIMLVEAGAMLALAQILSYLTIYQSPLGGSVTPGSMIPIFIFAVRWGWKKGIMLGAVYGVLQFLLGPKWSMHPFSLLFDYPLAFAPLGLAGLYVKSIKGISVGIVLGMMGRFVSHVLSGVIVFASYAPEGQNPWAYSVIYNASYIVPELIISIIVMGALYVLLVKNKIIKVASI